MRLADQDPGPYSTRVDDLAAFDRGVAAGLDPQKAGDTARRDASGAAGESAVTHLSSPWNHRLCDTCGHTFRRGDTVRLGASGGPEDIVHLDPALRCGIREPAGDDRRDVEGAEAFAVGLLAAWPLDGVPVTRLTPDDWQVARPAVHGRRPPRCHYCAHTFRAGEHVVLCPCRPQRPACGSAVHRDPAAGLVCWESWRPEGRLTVCPVTQVPVTDE